MIKSYVVDLLSISVNLKDKTLRRVYHGMKDTMVNITESDYLSFFSQTRDVRQKIKVYTDKGEVIGFTSWRVEKVMITHQWYCIHRSLNIIKPDKRNLSSEKFLIYETIKYNLHKLLCGCQSKSMFMCRADGPVTYYVFNKYFANVYPSVNGRHDPRLEKVAQFLVRHFGLSLVTYDPIKVSSAFQSNDPKQIKHRWLKKKDQSVQYYFKHCPGYLDNEHPAQSLLVVFDCGLKNLILSMLNLVKSRGLAWFDF